MMLSSFEKLHRMLIQERRLGYKNNTVFGGFEKFAPNWSTDALKEVSSPEEKALVGEIEQSLYNYPTVSEADRPNYIHQLLVKLHKSGPNGPGQTNGETKPPAKAPVRHEPPPPPPPAGSEAEVEAPAAEPADDPPPEPESLPRPARQPGPPPPSRPGDSASSRDPWRQLAHVKLESPVTRLPGIKDALAKKLSRLGVESVGDVIHLYPRRYDDYSALKPINRLEYGEQVTIIAQVWETRQRNTRSKLPIITSVLSDGTATIEATWFNMPWLEKVLRPGKQIVVSGTVEAYLGRLTFQSPDWEDLDKNLLHTGRIVPIYPLTKGVTNRWLRTHVKKTVDTYSNRIPDYLPEESRQRLKMLSLDEALRQIHYPDDWNKLEAARRRLAFDELLLIQLGVTRQRLAWQTLQSRPVNIEPEAIDRLLQTLPFELTAAQQQSLADIARDLARAVPMSRLLQGDVGSGKTVVALAAMVLTALDGGQSAILAPTEILAEQHFKSMGKLLAVMGQALGRPFNISLLTGSTPAAERRELLQNLADGHINILVGTHAIIQSNVELKNLRLAVIDEQHRFGVKQRAALRDKGLNPHMLVMTATPIPRTLALTLYGDLDVSVIDEMPPGRQVIETHWLAPRERERAYRFIQAQVDKGRQAFIICPLVEETEKTEAKAAVEEHQRLQTEVFPQLKLGLLHGRLKTDDKEQAMMAFRDQQTQVLVSTSVVEVGIDIPNASVILIEGANRFGLAQLHQFRGRVGRGEHKSYCMLLADSPSAEAESRLQVMEKTNNGFELAEEDLKLRGPGEFFGTRQSGLPDLKLVKLTDTRLLDLARREAQAILEADPALSHPDHHLLVRQLDNFWSIESDLS
jgi:ATP-dependent DNA helicase RecG